MSNEAKSKILSPRAVRALERLGDIVCPGDGETPAYSECGCVEHVDKAIAYAPTDDIKSLNLLLRVLSFMPNFVLRWLVNKMTGAHQKQGGLSATFRLLDFGVKGIIFGTYYSGMVGKDYKGKKPTEAIAFELKRLK